MERSIFDKELKRVLVLCDNCGVCIDLCPMFNSLFDHFRSGEGASARLDDDQWAKIVNLCYDCKICLFSCPLKFDVPELVQKGKAAFYSAKGKSFGTKLLENIGLISKLASYTAPFSNYLAKLPLARSLVDALTGIDRRRKLFEFQRRSLHKRLSSRKVEESALVALEVPALAKVAYFSGCYAGYSDQALGLDALKLLEAAGAEVIHPEQKCCELPKITHGNMRQAMANIEYNSEWMSQAVRDGYDIVTTCASCNMTISFEYPDIIRSEDSKTISRRTYDIVHYLQMLQQAGRLNINPARLADRYAYYAPCHLRALRVGRPFVTLMEDLTGAVVDELEDVCCGFGGCWGFMAENYDESMAQGARLFADVERLSGATIVTDCPLCAMQIEQGSGKKAIHPAKILAGALRR